MPKFGMKEVMDVTLYDIVTGKPKITFDTLKTSDVEVTTEPVYARGGRGNAKLATWEGDKDATMNITDALISTRSLELVSGMATVVGAQTIPFRQKNEYDITDPSAPYDKGGIYPLTCTGSGQITLAYTPVTDITNISLYLATDDCGEPIDMTGATLNKNVITLGENGRRVAASKEVVAYYEYISPETSESWTIAADKFAGTYKMVGTTVIRNVDTGKDEAFYMILPRIKWSSGFTLNFTAEGEPTTIESTVEIMRAPNSSAMIQMIKA